ncbi:unnamed protein product [Medioppia subpectinata]|uniref:Uncharacterized protein n=1 Tax=Medioppia subpectinata TaxID=1979941 RepID=A0A7R9KWT8_9ACAR|nr:unnamed protein product [Medioppia subpectinata]CAG2111192.1 unnamed protein product [Medioppia subpectinata]
MDVTDELLEQTVFPYENFGNGVRNADNLEQIRHDCSVQGFRLNPVSKSKLREFKEIRDRFMGYLNEVLNSDRVDWAQLV